MMRAREIISRVLFWLGLLLDIGSIAALECLNYGRSTVWVREFDLLGAAVVIGLVMMATSIAIDLVTYIKEIRASKKENREDR